MRGQVESIQDPEWWDQDAVMDVVDHVCEKAGRNTGMAAIFKGNKKQPIMAKVSMRHLNEMIREKNAFAREVNEAWQDYVHLKTRMDSEVAKVTKRNNFLVEELENWKQQVLRLSLSIFVVSGGLICVVREIPSVCRATYSGSPRPQIQN